MKYQAIKGMSDIFYPEVAVWQEIEGIARKCLSSYGYKEIRTPALEDTAIFVRGIGDTTDIVTKEMYTFKDRKDRSLTLRPEGTAPIVRAYIEHGFDRAGSELKLFYIGPMFRSERPQKGRSRQFHQIGAEVFGSASAYSDAEIIIQLDDMLKLFGLSGCVFKLNSLGCKKDKETFAAVLRDYLKDKKANLCDDCKTRIDKNVFRMLDCKSEGCIKVMRDAPSVAASLCSPCASHFDKVKKILNKMNISFKEEKNLVRGLDYYTGTVFEISHPSLGAQDALGAGGRYNNLVHDLGGSDTGAIGYALGMERLVIALNKKPQSEKNVLYIATMGDDAKLEALKISQEIRKALSITVLTDIKEASLKSQMRSADKNEASLALIIGEDEIKLGTITLRDMATKEQVSVGMSDIVSEIKKRIK